MPAVALAIIAYCRWWLYDRLVCLGGDRCAIGMLLTIEPPENKSGLDRFDTDYSINLLLAPHRVGDSRASIEADGLQGQLIAERPATKDENLDFDGYATRQWGNDPKTPMLHAGAWQPRRAALKRRSNTGRNTGLFEGSPPAPLPRLVGMGAQGVPARNAWVPQ